MDIEVLDAKITKNRIKAALAAAELSQEEAARLAGVSCRHFSRVTLGQREPTLLVAAAMAKVLGLRVDQLFTIVLTTRRARVRTARAPTD